LFNRKIKLLLHLNAMLPYPCRWGILVDQNVQMQKACYTSGTAAFFVRFGGRTVVFYYRYGGKPWETPEVNLWGNI
jgi:hypothetical protein